MRQSSDDSHLTGQYPKVLKLRSPSFSKFNEQFN